MTREFLLSLHALIGVGSMLGALWVFVETLNARSENIRRIRAVALATAVLMLATWAAGGYWYVTYYPVDKAIILKGAWPAAHTFVMEAKEHLFFIPLLLSLLLPVAAREDLAGNKRARLLLLALAALTVLSALAMEGMGALITIGVRMGMIPL